MSSRPVRSAAAAAAAALSALSLGAVTIPAAASPAPVSSGPHRASAPHRASRACPPHARAVSYSDNLDKLVRHGVEVGGLSSLAYDRRSRAFVSAVDNNKSDPARIWFFRDLRSPHVTRDPLVLRRPDGTPYTGMTADDEGLAVLPGGRYLVSSETEPSIRIFGRDGVQRAHFPVPARFAVTGTTRRGQATSNATLEGLTISPDGHRVVAAMEGALSGDLSTSGDSTYHRFLVYRKGRLGWRLAEQLGYRAGKGMRIPEVASYGQHGLLVEEASFSTTTGNTVELYAVPDLRRGRDISRVANLSRAPHRVLHKTLVADLVRCPTLGAPAKETQRNPLLDNFEGMGVFGATGRTRHGAGTYRVGLISDDNFSDGQTTRVLDLLARLPGDRGRYSDGGRR